MTTLTTPALVVLIRTAQITVIQRVPAHYDVRGNERADGLAKEGGSTEQPDELVSFAEIITIIKAHQPKKWLL